MGNAYRPEDGLLSAIAAAGLPPLTVTIKYGDVTRWGDTNKSSSKPCWLVAYPLNNGHIAAVFGDWRIGSRTEYRTWENGRPTDPNEAQRLLDELARRQKLADEKAAASQAATAKHDAAIWELLPEPGDSAYLARKGVGAYGIRYGADQYGKFIAVPMHTADGAFKAFQRIYEDGRKRFPKGAAKKGTYHLIGTLEADGPLYFTEGYATAASVHEATGKPAVVCFDSGNLRAVADALKAVYPELTLIMAADNDQWKADELDGQGRPKGNAGIKAAYAAARAHPGTRVAIPNFENLDVSIRPTDFNDIAQLAGPEAVKRQLERAKEPKPKPDATAPASSTFYSLVEWKGETPYLVQQSIAATILAQHYRGQIAFDATARTWQRYNGIHWEEISDFRAFATIDGWIEQGAAEVGYTTGYVHGVSDFLKARLLIDSPNQDPNLVPFRNGLLNLKTGELCAHSPENHITWCLPYQYDPAARCSKVIAWIYETVGRDNLQVQLVRAYLKAVITGRADLQRFLQLLGPGGGGKGTLMRLAEALVGRRNTHVTTLKRLETNRFETAQLYNKRLCLVTDSERYAGEISVFKAATGQDLLPNEKKHQNPGEPFIFRGMMIMSANEELTTADLTSGFQRRRITARFDNVVPEEQRRDLGKEFEPELPGVLNWALRMDDERLRQLLVETARYIPTLGAVALDTLIATNNIAAWLDSCVVPDSAAETPVGRKQTVSRSEPTDYHGSRKTVTEYLNADEWLYPNYCKFCAEAGTVSVSGKRFTDLLTDLTRNQLKLQGIEHLPKKSSKLSRFKGIRLRTDADEHRGGLADWAQPTRNNLPGQQKDSSGQQKDSKRTANGEYRDSRDSKIKLFSTGAALSEKSNPAVTAEHGESHGPGESAEQKNAHMGKNAKSAVLRSLLSALPQAIDTKGRTEKPCCPPAVPVLSANAVLLSTTDESPAVPAPPRPIAPLSADARTLLQWLQDSKATGWKPCRELAQSLRMDSERARTAAAELATHRLARLENDSVRLAGPEAQP